MFEKVKEFFATHAEIPADTIHLDSELAALGVASLQLLMVITEFENEFGVTISDSELEKIHTIKDIVTLVEDKTL